MNTSTTPKVGYARTLSAEIFQAGSPEAVAGSNPLPSARELLARVPVAGHLVVVLPQLAVGGDRLVAVDDVLPSTSTNAQLLYSW